ncbi:F0F1 ATP synthase subunit epsilon [Mycoplasma phocimorsus]|uniref:ATP synthase epsilon chain n=1 Tax=Mycoplasma phocimorsus TaxID=3045839 RepID=A0AAJ1PQK3_9MOLU|nr:F0F1 ATP synthase subunit epsilon [Mycoplasma phocimorsus]MDJ1645514.1 F0F1 ATP synthase subunit epsilon [Mycoplasma phocimorsus]MDJ1646208.1 F0F1 ATP synthase subunit epsilon [Mycoplasma phocimorsus]MDJ1646806.1 F0F1 ATP synthase subunit epsilon [Mycoplasma phocimorsus]MDJ1647780.1 F0F1 ATP synthase subunit epsilon [Mycoplasma phocimorsus]MDJ1648194.1 F0F1 ATP synthase subunit epsilon [Mycoplasma phocimorsus]
MGNKVKLQITTPYGNVVDENVYMVVAKTTDGKIGLMSGKSPFIGNIVISELLIQFNVNKEFVSYAISNGIVMATPNLINIVTDSCIKVSEIDIQRALRQKDYAIAKIKMHKSAEKIAMYESELRKEINKINLYNK